MGFGYHRYNMRMAMTLDFSPPCERDTEKESERRSIFGGEFCGKLLIPEVLWMPCRWKMAKGWWGDGLPWGRLGVGLGRETARKLWGEAGPEAHLPRKVTGLFLSEEVRCSVRKAGAI